MIILSRFLYTTYLWMLLLPLFMSSLVHIQAQAQVDTEDHLSHRDSHWIQPHSPYIGLWKGEEFSLSLRSSGEANLKQTGLYHDPNQPSLHRSKTKKEPLHSTQVKQTIINGYWWSEAKRVCLSFELQPRCIPTRLSHQKGRRILSIKVNRIWVDLKAHHE